MTDLEALKKKRPCPCCNGRGDHAAECEWLALAEAAASAQRKSDEWEKRACVAEALRQTIIDELAEALKCDADEPVSGCDCRRCLVHATQRAHLARLDAEDALANARAATAEEAARLADEAEGREPGRNHSDLGDKILRLAPLPASVRCVRVEVLDLVGEALMEADCYLDDHGKEIRSVTKARAALAEFEEKP